MSAYSGRKLLRAVLSGSVAAIVATGCGLANAEPAPPFATLLRQSENAPRLAESAADVARAEGLSEQARARPNPTIGMLSENFAGSSPYRGFGRAETLVQISQPIELGGKQSARMAAGQAGIVASQARDLDARIGFAYDLARAYAGAEIADERIAIAQNEVDEATADLRAATALVRAGKEARLRSLQAEAALGALDAELGVAKANRIAAYSRLSALVGATEPFTSISESLLDRADAGPLASDPAQNSAYRFALAEREVAARRIDVERKRAIPDITATVGVRRLEQEGSTAILGGVSVPLHIFDRNRGNIAVSRADLQAAEARLAMARYDAEAGLRDALAQVEANDARVTAALASQATAKEAYRLAEIAYRTGKSSILELISVRKGLGDARRAVLDARAARLDARARLTRLQGRTISGDPIQ